MPSFCFLTIGCQMNVSDSEFYSNILLESGFVEAPEEEADIIFINTCAVREGSVHKLDSKLGELYKRKRQTGLPKVGVVGCVPAIDLESFKKRHKQVDFVLGTYHDRESMQGALEEALGFELEHGVSPRASSISAFVPITTGCDSFCTYCIVPYTRGRLVSRGVEEILSEAKSYIESGAREIVLLGQNVNAYGLDRGEKDAFVDLVQKVSELPGVLRVRFITSHPKDMNEEILLRLREIKNLAWFFHLPIQAGSDEVLSRMNRRYTVEDYRRLIENVRKIFPGAGVTTDVIVGFPGETEEQFEQTMALFRELRFEQAYMAMYSQRPKTPAANFSGQVDREELHRRVSAIVEQQKRIAEQVGVNYVGGVLSVLVENVENEYSFGLSETGRLVKIKGQFEKGTIVKVKISKPGMRSLEGEPVQ